VDRRYVWGRRRVAAWAARALVLGGLLLVVVVLPTDSPLGIALPLAIEVVTVAVVAFSASGKPAMSRAVWWCIAGSVALNTTADLIYAWQQNVLGEVPFPGWADPFYLASYLPELAAMVLLIRSRLPDAIPEELLDTTIITTPIAVLASVLVIQPGLAGQPWSSGTLLAVLYPILDVVVISALVRLSIGGGHRNRSLGLLAASVCVTLVADLLFTGLVTAGQVADMTGGMQALFTMGLLLMAAAALSSDAASITRPELARDDRPIPTGRIIALAVAALSLSMVALFGIGVDQSLDFQVLAAGAVVVIVLVGWRSVRLMLVVNVQRQLLDETARTDALTGLPNRRSWDYEVQRWDARATQAGHLLTVAILDLDHFKDYNDQHGHLAGDALLQDCARAWRDALPPEAYLARYGGEEFAAILPDTPATGARPVLERVRQATPTVTVSIGYAEHRPNMTLTEVLADADAALYAAKQAGRNRVIGISGRIQNQPTLHRPVSTAPLAALGVNGSER
jgi:diguanylate cyclase (GGDEF)-like protein